MDKATLLNGVLMKDSVKAMTITAVILLAIGITVLVLGAVSFALTKDESGANIGGGISLLFGPALVGLGLIFGLVAGVTTLIGHRHNR